MKLDTELIRDLLIYFEETLPDKKRWVVASSIKLEGYTSHQIMSHIPLLLDCEYIKASSQSADNMTDYFISRLTMNGHQFLDLIRNDNLWKHIKTLLGKIGLEALPILTTYLMPIIKQQLGLP
jgi:hypothetical protein